MHFPSRLPCSRVVCQTPCFSQCSFRQSSMCVLPSTSLLRVARLPYPELPPHSIFILPMPFPPYFTPLHADLTSSSLASLLHRCHSKLPSPWNISFPLPSWTWLSLRSPDLCAKYEHRTVSCAFSSSKTRPFLIAFLFDSMTSSSFRLSFWLRNTQ